jgi:hypothetical protein
MQQVLNHNGYFGEDAMKLRQPALYHQYVGQYLTPDDINEISKTYQRTSLSEQLLFQYDAQQSRYWCCCFFLL